MTSIILLAAAAAATVNPTLQFTNDSVYTQSKILTYTVQENYSGTELVSKDLLLSEGNVLGYTIYDDKNTAYIDGLRIDGEYIYNWSVPNYDDTVAHTIQIKTTYSDDIAGMLAAAADGDWSKVLSNPVMILQLVYYLLAAASIIIGAFGLVKSKKAKVKSATEIAELVNTNAEKSMAALNTRASEIIDQCVLPVLMKLKSQNQDIIEALVLTQSDDEKAATALVDLLKKASTEDISELAEEIKKAISKAAEEALVAKEDAQQTIKDIAEGVYEVKSKEDDGTSI